MTPTAALADVVLPAAGNLERDEPRLHLHTKGPQATFMDTVSQKLVEIGERRSDWEFVMSSAASSATRNISHLSKRSPSKPSSRWARPGTSLRRRTTASRFPSSTASTKRGLRDADRQVRDLLDHYGGVGIRPLPGHVEASESPISTPERFAEYPLILNTGAKQPMFWHSQGRQFEVLAQIEHGAADRDQCQNRQEHGIEQGDYVWIETVRGRLRMRAHLHDAITRRSSRSRTAGGCPRKRDRITESSRCARTCSSTTIRTIATWRSVPARSRGYCAVSPRPKHRSAR